MRKLSTALVGLLLTGCSAKITADLLVGAKPFLPISCTSGERTGFAGIELTDGAGARLRLVAMPDGQADAFVFPAGTDIGTELGACGPFTLERQSSRINGIRNVSGTAKLSCKGRTEVSGSVQFENCH